MIKKHLVFSLFILLAVGTSAQSSKLVPGASFTNQSTDTLYIIPMQQVKSLLSSAVNNDINEQKLELYKNKISLFEERSALADSAMTIKKLEADYWHSQLLQNDQLLENQRIENIKLIDEKNRIRQSRVYYLVAGLVAGAVIVSL
ncbi:hypothetical protein [uncultured Sunxiuqinia sp.]|uniref:hypothetical protein n=1 Tax=uncultured Sunxiuqinia sp. TaxID=1573825 RepID=UPI0030D7AD34|tara:strand:- start:3103 stop:3537 length:435 start_codon:yes stop_codon:yes gene_type:complete